MVNKQVEPRGGRAPQRKSGIGIFVPLLVVVILIGGAGLAMLGGKKKPVEQPKGPDLTKPQPFADLPPEEPPKKKTGGSRANFIAQAPEGLENDATWLKAVAIGEEGEALYEAAVKAKNSGDNAVLTEKGREARKKLNEATEMTGAWEEELLAKYGDANSNVRGIKNKRSEWLKMLLWLHKSAAL